MPARALCLPSNQEGDANNNFFPFFKENSFTVRLREVLSVEGQGPITPEPISNIGDSANQYPE